MQIYGIVLRRCAFECVCESTLYVLRDCVFGLCICLVVYAKVLFVSVCVQIQSALQGAHLHLFIEH